MRSLPLWLLAAVLVLPPAAGAQKTPPPPPPVASIDDITIHERDIDSPLHGFTVTLSQPATQDMLVHARVTDVTATAGEDFFALPSSRIAKGATTGTLAVRAVGDLVREPDETFTVSLVPSSSIGVARGVGTATILDDDRHKPPAAPGLTARTTPGRDGVAPYRFRTSGRLIPALTVTTADGCKGQVSVQIKRGARTLSRRTVAVDRRCRFVSDARLGRAARLPRRGTLRVIVRFRGNEVLVPKAVRAHTVRYGPAA